MEYKTEELTQDEVVERLLSDIISLKCRVSQLEKNNEYLQDMNDGLIKTIMRYNRSVTEELK